MQVFSDFSSFEEGFLRPLSAKRAIKTEERPLTHMERWKVNEQGHLIGSHFEVIGQRVELYTDRTNPNSTPMTWDQPIYQQGSGTLALIIDEQERLLLRAVFEPGNSTRGYQNSGLILCTTCKFSQGNLAQQKAQGKIPPFSDLLDHPSTHILRTIQAPGDGARANKQNTHHVCQVTQELIESSWNSLDPMTQENYALVSKAVFKTAYLDHALVGEHLRDLSSLLLFTE